jgi:hypothetical protein
VDLNQRNFTKTYSVCSPNSRASSRIGGTILLEHYSSGLVAKDAACKESQVNVKTDSGLQSPEALSLRVLLPELNSSAGFPNAVGPASVSQFSYNWNRCTRNNSSRSFETWIMASLYRGKNIEFWLCDDFCRMPKLSLYLHKVKRDSELLGSKRCVHQRLFA